MKRFKIFVGRDYYNRRPVYQVMDKVGDYVGEFHKSRKDAQAELKDLMRSIRKNPMKHKTRKKRIVRRKRRVVRRNPEKGVWSHVPFIRLSNSRTGKKIKTYPLDSLKWTAKERSDIKTLMEVGGRAIQIGDFVYEKRNALARARSNAWPRNALGMTITPVNYSGLRGNPMIEDREGYSTYRKAGFGNYQQWFEAGCPVKSTYVDSQGRFREKIKYTCSGKILPFPTSGRIQRNPPMYAHGMTAHRTHGLSLKQMMKLYRLVSSGNQKAVMYARRTLGIPMSESLSQVKAVVYHHVMDLKGKI